MVIIERTARVAATALLAAVAFAAAASPALAGTTHPAAVHHATVQPAARPGLSRGPLVRTAMDGAAIMLLATIGLLLLLRREPKPAVPPKPKPKPAAVPKPKPAAVPKLKPAAVLKPKSVAMLKPKSAAVPKPKLVPPPVPDGENSLRPGLAADDASEPVCAPSWLGAFEPLDDPGPPSEPAAGPESKEPAVGQVGSVAPVSQGGQGEQPAVAKSAASSDDEPSWPDFLALASPVEQAAAQGTVPVPEPGPGPEPQDHGEAAEGVFSPDALRLLGVRPPWLRGEDEMPAQRHQVTLGDDWIEVVLAEAPAPCVAWAALPYDVPGDGPAFACIGAGDDGCLFVDLAAAPGAVSITGEADAATRLAESIVYQLCSRTPADQASSVLLVGSAIPRPHPANTTWVERLHDLQNTSLDSPPDSTDIVFCELCSDEDASLLARYVATSARKVIPVVLGYLPGASWSLTALPGAHLDEGLPFASLTSSPGLLA